MESQNSAALAGLEGVEVPDHVKSGKSEEERVRALAAQLAASQTAAVLAEVEDLKRKLAASTAANEEMTKVNAQKQLADHHRNAANESHASSKARYAIILDEARDPNEVDPVPVGVNGRMYQLKRGQLVEVPIEVVDVLKNAIENRSSTKLDAQGNPAGLTIRQARRFPFQNYGMIVNEAGERQNIALPVSNAA
jgi:hypothetical protein